MKLLLHSIIGLICLLTAPFVYGQETYEGLICIKQNQAQLKQDSLYLEMEVSIHGLKINDRQSLYLYPTLTDGKNSVVLAPIILNGTKIHQKASRAIALHGEYKPQKDAFAVLKNNPVVFQVIMHRDTLVFQPWMKETGVKLTGQIKDQNNNIIQTFDDTLATKLNLFE